MLGRAVIAAAGAALLSGGGLAQTPPSDAPAAKVATQREAAKKRPNEIAEPAEAVPDPLTPPEVAGPPPAAPGAEAEAQAAPVVAVAAPEPVLEEIRRQLAATPRGRDAGETGDRAALAAFYAMDGARVLWTDAAGLTPRGKLAIEEIGKADDWGLKASAFELPSLPADAPSEAARAGAEIRLGLAVLRYARHARGGRLDPQSVSKLFDRKPQVYEPRSLLKAIAAASAPDAYLRDLHPKHTGFRNLQKALVAARAQTTPPPAPVAETEPPAESASKSRRGKQTPKRKPASQPSQSDTVQRLVANMERWRWMPVDLGAFHVWNNVPEQMTTVFKNGQPVFNERIVVGKPDTATPNFSANMQFVIFQPEWGVPNGIKNNEIGPLLRRASSNNNWFFGGGGGPTASSVLARHGLRVSYGGQVVNPESVNWSAVDINRFSFIQPAGPTNVLGVVKFRFPNKHDVYMHDTPQKHLFSSTVRAFSHGCMRVQNPVRFAEVLLEHDKGWSADRVRSMVPRGGEVKLSTEIPVHNVYFTAVADADGKVRTLGDLYGVDSRIISALEGRFVTVPSRGEPVTGEPPAEGPVAQRARGGERQARQQRRGPTTASSEPSNPFAGLFGN